MWNIYVTFRLESQSKVNLPESSFPFPVSPSPFPSSPIDHSLLLTWIPIAFFSVFGKHMFACLWESSGERGSVKSGKCGMESQEQLGRPFGGRPWVGEVWVCGHRAGKVVGVGAHGGPSPRSNSWSQQSKKQGHCWEWGGVGVWEVEGGRNSWV